MVAALSALELKRGLLEARASRVVRWVAFLQIKNNWLPVPIAKSKGARLTGWSERTWGRAVANAVALGWIRREVRSGRVKGNRAGYNPGSLFAVAWDYLPSAAKPNYRDRPAFQVAARALHVGLNSRSPNGQKAEGILYSPQDQTPSSEPGHGAKEAGHLGTEPNTEPGHGTAQPGHIGEYRTVSNLHPVRPYGRDVGAADPETPAAALPGAPDGVPSPHPNPSPQGEGRPAGKGDPCPPALQADVRQQPWYRGRRP